MSDASPDVCTYCQARGCIEGSVEHVADCPQATHVYTYTEQDAAIHGGFVCTACDDPFTVGEAYVEVDADPTHPAPGGAEDALRDMGIFGADGYTWALCLGCAALGIAPRPEEHQ